MLSFEQKRIAILEQDRLMLLRLLLEWSQRYQRLVAQQPQAPAVCPPWPPHRVRIVDARGGILHIADRAPHQPVEAFLTEVWSKVPFDETYRLILEAA